MYFIIIIILSLAKMLPSNSVLESSCLCCVDCSLEKSKCIYIYISGMCVCVGGRDVSHRLKKHLQPPVGLFCISPNHTQPGMQRVRNRAVLQQNMTFWHHQLVCDCPRQTQRSTVSKLEDSSQELTLNRHRNTFLSCFPPPLSLIEDLVFPHAHLLHKIRLTWRMRPVRFLVQKMNGRNMLILLWKNE